MRRREFITLVGGAATSSLLRPLAARAQQAMPVVGCIGIGKSETVRDTFSYVGRGLAEVGYVVGQNLSVEYRAADYHLDRLAVLAADLVQRQVAAIIVFSGPALSAAMAATKSIPIVFFTGFDPVASGFVVSLNRPGGNCTGIFSLNPGLLAKRLELLHEVVPAAKSIGILLSPSGFPLAATLKDLSAAAGALGVQLLFQNASEPGELESAFASLVDRRAGAVEVSADAVFTNNRDQLIALAARHKIPAIYPIREYTAGGGLVSYGTNYPDAFRQVGVYAGRILKGEKPADLPVQQVTKIELVINMKTAKTLGLTFPLSLLGRADEVIE